MQSIHSSTFPLTIRNHHLTNDISQNPTLQRLISASFGSVLTSLLVTPLDVVKTRLQQQTHSSATSPSTVSFLNCPRYSVALDVCCRQYHAAGFSFLNSHTRACPSSFSTTYTSTLDAILKITRHEGISALWKGLVPTLVMSLPANVIYFLGYETLREYLLCTFPPQTHVMAPLLAGAMSRTIAVSTISPLELLRTQMQSVHAANKPVQEIIQSITHNIQQTGPRYLWRGLSITLARDVPFSAIYWTTYESLKRTWAGSAVDPGFGPFVSGACAGMVAAAVTTPLDVVKTRFQANPNPKKHISLPNVLLAIAHNEGTKGLFAGVLPRVAKVAPACAIMIGSYEYGKYYFNNERPSSE